MNRMRAKSLALFVMAAVPAQAQYFDSRSTGADGALESSTPGTIVFDQQSRLGDNVYHFTSIHIGTGVTVKLSSRHFSGSVFWLSQGPVEIDGAINLDGEAGGRTPSLAGAGGYPGGVIGKLGYAPPGFKPNIFLVPLVGGSGGDGGETSSGGAGGGALLIASSVSIAINGVITANGGSSDDGLGGNGGAIRLVAPVILGSTGSLSAKGGQPQGSGGLIRFESFDNQFTGSLNNTPVAQGKPLGLFLPLNHAPSVRVISFGSKVGTREDSGTKRRGAAVVVEARYIPLGTVVELEFFSENGTSQRFLTSPLDGTFEQSRAIALVTLPNGFSYSHATVSWKRPEPPK